MIILKNKSFTKAEKEAIKELLFRTRGLRKFPEGTNLKRGHSQRLGNMAADLRDWADTGKRPDTENIKEYLNQLGLKKGAAITDKVIDKYSNKRAMARLERMKKNGAFKGSSRIQKLADTRIKKEKADVEKIEKNKFLDKFGKAGKFIKDKLKSDAESRLLDKHVKVLDSIAAKNQKRYNKKLEELSNMDEPLNQLLKDSAKNRKEDKVLNRKLRKQLKQKNISLIHNKSSDPSNAGISDRAVLRRDVVINFEEAKAKKEPIRTRVIPEYSGIDKSAIQEKTGRAITPISNAIMDRSKAVVRLPRNAHPAVGYHELGHFKFSRTQAGKRLKEPLYLGPRPKIKDKMTTWEVNNNIRGISEKLSDLAHENGASEQAMKDLIKSGASKEKLRESRDILKKAGGSYLNSTNLDLSLYTPGNEIIYNKLLRRSIY